MKRNLTYLFICAIIIGATAGKAGATALIKGDNKRISSSAASYTSITASAADTTKAAGESNKKTDATADDKVIDGVTRPSDDEKDPAVWAKYFNEAIAAIKKMSNDADKKAAWERISADMLKLSKNHPDRITAGAINKLMSEMTAVLKEKHRDSSVKIDVSKAQANLIKAALNFVKSKAFDSLKEARQNNVVAVFGGLAIETSWRSEFNKTNKDLYVKIGQFYKAALESKNEFVKARAFNSLMHLYRVDSWGSKEGNKDIANEILKEALKVKGGVKGLLKSFQDAADNKNLSADVRGHAAIAIGNLIYHNSQLSKQGDYKMTDKDLKSLSKTAANFLKGVNKGNIDVSASVRNGMMHMLGGAINVLMNQKKYAGNDTYSKFSGAFIEMAKDSYLLSKKNGGSTSLQTTAINVLTQMRNIATATKNNTLATQCKKTLLNKNFNIPAFIDKAKEEAAKTTNADYGAYVCRAMANLAKINLENNTGKVSTAAVKNIISTIKTWVSNSDNLLNMRGMQWQNALYKAVADMAKELYKKGARIDDSVGKDLAAIFNTSAGLKDSLVKKNAAGYAMETAGVLRENGFKDAANKIILAVATSSETLTAAAWNAYNDKDYASAKLFADKVIADYADKAAKQQKSLKGYAPPGKESKYWALNDVATAYFILGKSALEKGNKNNAREYFKKIVTSYGYAQCYDPKTKSYWKVKEAAQKELKKL
jgi:hypothetical protein